MAEYSRELTGLKGAAGLAGATGRSLLNIAQSSDLEKILGRSLEQEKFAEGAYRGEGQREQRMGQYGGPFGAAGIGAIIGLIFGKTPQAVKMGYDIGSTAGEWIGQKGAVTSKGWKERGVPEMPESLGEVPVRFHKSKAAILGKKRSDFNRYMQKHQVDLTTQRGRNFMNRVIDNIQFMVAENPQSRKMVSDWMDPDIDSDFDIFGTLKEAYSRESFMKPESILGKMFSMESSPTPKPSMGYGQPYSF